MYPDVKIVVGFKGGLGALVPFLMIQAGFLHTQLLHEHSLLLGIVQLGNVRLQLGADGHRRSLIFRISNLLVAFLKVKCYNGSNYA